MVQIDKNAELAAAVLSVALATVLLGIAIGLVLYARSHRHVGIGSAASKELLDNFEIDSDAQSETGSDSGDDNGVTDLAGLKLATGPLCTPIPE